jgi:class 3 adenylate cyclase
MAATPESQLNEKQLISPPPRKLSDRIREAAKKSFIGRQEELSILSNAIEADDPPFFVAYVHGPGGVGKSRLVQAAMVNISPEINRYIMDCREIEPTPQGFQIALGALLEVRESEPDFATVVNCLAEQNQRSVLALDTYETFGLMDTWLRHLNENPLEPGERVLFLPRWLDRETGEKPSAAVGAFFLDIKRTYMALRPGLRRIYSAVIDWDTLEPVLFPLGNTQLEKFKVSIGGITYHTLMNDFGPSSIDGWLAGLIGTEPGVESTDAQETKASNRSGIAHGRKLLTVLFTDIVASTQKAVEMGDSRWRDLLENHHKLVRQKLEKFQGHEIDTSGDGFFATFDQPANAVQCASAVSRAVGEFGIQIRSGLHLGDCEVTAEAVRGITVHIGARVASKAEAGEVWVSSTLKEAIAGSDIRFKDRGAHELKGIPGEWSLFTVKH